MVYAKDSIWMGKWYVRGKPVKRSLGPMRQPGSREGMTKTQAEAKLRDLISETSTAPPPVAEGLTVEQVGSRLITQLKAKNRKPSTVENYESYLRVHLAPHFGETPVSEITVDDIEDSSSSALPSTRSRARTTTLDFCTGSSTSRSASVGRTRTRAGSPRSRSRTASIVTSAFSTRRSSRRCSKQPAFAIATTLRRCSVPHASEP